MTLEEERFVYSVMEVFFFAEQMEFVSEGSSRVIFKHRAKGKDQIVKIAKNQKGIDQNLVEIDVTGKSPEYAGTVYLPITQYENTKSPRWVLTDVATPLEGHDSHSLLGYIKSFGRNSTKVEKVNFTHQDIETYIFHQKGLREHALLSPQVEHFFENSEFVQSLVDFIGKHEIGISDSLRSSNWGFFGDKLLLIDYGADFFYLEKHYFKGKVYQYDFNGFLCGMDVAQESPKEPGVFLMPKNTTKKKPSEFDPNTHIPRFNHSIDDWELLPIDIEQKTPQDKLRDFLSNNPDVLELIQQ